MSFITSIKTIIKDCVVKLNEKQKCQNVTFKDENEKFTKEDFEKNYKWYWSEETDLIVRLER